MRRTSIALVGFMCAGKSTVGRKLAARLGKSFIETDALVEERAGMSVAQVFQSYGEERFRDLEAEVVARASTMPDSVVACGGGAVLRSANVERLKAGATVVYLDVSPEKVIERLGPRSEDRPLLSGEDRESRVLRLMEARRTAYLAAADLVVDTSSLTPDEVVTRIQALLQKNERTR